MEYLRVHFYGPSRLVLLNGNQGGFTNMLITVPLPGTYRVSLAPPVDYVPGVQEVELAHTGLFSPMELTFHSLPVSTPHT